MFKNVELYEQEDSGKRKYAICQYLTHSLTLSLLRADIHNTTHYKTRLDTCENL